MAAKPWVLPPDITYDKGKYTVLSNHFYSKEFDCPCSECGITIINPVLVKFLESMRVLQNAPVEITSGYRCHEYQLDLKARGYETASGVSTHELGHAADIKIKDLSGKEMDKLARSVGFRAVGVGNDWIHCDIRLDKDRHWGYKSS